MLAGSASVSARYHAPYEGSRIYWDVSSKQELFPSGNYARLIELADGRLMVAAEAGGGISVRYSSDGGATWTTAERIVKSADRVPYAVPDLTQLADGTILVGFNPRPSTPYSDERRFGIRTMRSTDNGATWEGPIFIYDAQMTFEDGCWEPSFLQLPSGEVHCYFANENNFVNSNEQEISVSRSLDGGQTWSEASRVCYRAGSRDGMPSAILTPEGEIVVIVEDNGHGGYGGFRATTVRCSLENNWKSWVDAGSANRSMIFADSYDKGFISAAPYLRQFKSGETVASWQGDRGERAGKGENFFDMFVAVGDANARGFKAVTEPFGLELTDHALWNSVGVAGENTVFALASIGGPNKGNAINLMQGKLLKGFEADFGTPDVENGGVVGDWTATEGEQVLMGLETRNRSAMDFLYDDENLYFVAKVNDRTQIDEGDESDGVFLYLDTDNISDVSPQKGIFRLFLNLNGEVEMAQGSGGRWLEQATPEGVEMTVTKSRTNYVMKMKVAWKALGLEGAPVEKLMRCNLAVRDRRNSTTVITDVIADVENDRSWTWPELKLNDNGGASVEAPEVGETAVSMIVDGGVLRVAGSDEIGCVRVYSMAGGLIAEVDGAGCEGCVVLDGVSGVVVVEVVMADGGMVHGKVLL